MKHLNVLKYISELSPEVDTDGYAPSAKILLARIDKGELTPEAALSLLFILEDGADEESA